MFILILDVQSYRSFQRKARDNQSGRTGLIHERGMAKVLVVYGKGINAFIAKLKVYLVSIRTQSPSRVQVSQMLSGSFSSKFLKDMQRAR